MLRMLVHILLIMTLAAPPLGWSSAEPCTPQRTTCACCPADSCEGCLCNGKPDSTPVQDRSQVEPSRQIVAVLPTFVRTCWDRDFTAARVGCEARPAGPSSVRRQALLCQWLT